MEKRMFILIYCWWECKLVHPLWKTGQVHQKLKIEPSADLEIPFLVVYPKKIKITLLKWYLRVHVHCNIVYYYYYLVKWSVSHLVMSNSLQKSLSHVQLFAIPWTKPTRLLCTWNSPGKNIGVGCCALLQGVFLT